MYNYWTSDSPKCKYYNRFMYSLRLRIKKIERQKKLLCLLLECLIFLFSLPNFFFICLICFGFEGGGSTLPFSGFSWLGLNVGVGFGLTDCGCCSCFGLTDCGGGGGGLVGCHGRCCRVGRGAGIC